MIHRLLTADAEKKGRDWACPRYQVESLQVVLPLQSTQAVHAYDTCECYNLLSFTESNLGDFNSSGAMFVLLRLSTFEDIAIDAHS